MSPPGTWHRYGLPERAVSCEPPGPVQTCARISNLVAILFYVVLFSYYLHSEDPEMFSVFILAGFLLLMSFQSPDPLRRGDSHKGRAAPPGGTRAFPSLGPCSASTGMLSFSTVPWSVRSLTCYLLSTYCVPGAVPRCSNMAGNKELIFWWAKVIKKEGNLGSGQWRD